MVANAACCRHFFHGTDGVGGLQVAATESGRFAPVGTCYLCRHGACSRLCERVSLLLTMIRTWILVDFSTICRFVVCKYCSDFLDKTTLIRMQ